MGAGGLDGAGCRAVARQRCARRCEKPALPNAPEEARLHRSAQPTPSKRDIIATRAAGPANGASNAMNAALRQCGRPAARSGQPGLPVASLVMSGPSVARLASCKPSKLAPQTGVAGSLWRQRQALAAAPADRPSTSGAPPATPRASVVVELPPDQATAVSDAARSLLSSLQPLLKAVKTTKTAKGFGARTSAASATNRLGEP